MYAVNDRTSRGGHQAVARLNWAIPTPQKKISQNIFNNKFLEKNIEKIF